MSDNEIEDVRSDDSDSEGSLVDFIVNDEEDEHDKACADAGDEVSDLLSGMTEEEKQMLTSGRPKRTRRATVRYIDPDYASLMEINDLDDDEKKYILGSSSDEEDIELPPKRKRRRTTKDKKKKKKDKKKKSKKRKDTRKPRKKKKVKIDLEKLQTIIDKNQT